METHDQIQWKKEFDEQAKYNERYEPMLGCCGGDYCPDQTKGHNQRIKDFIQLTLQHLHDEIMEDIKNTDMRSKSQMNIIKNLQAIFTRYGIKS